MKIKLIIIIFLFTSIIQSQSSNSIIADDILIHPVLHASMVIEYQGKTIYVDPYGGAELYSGYKNPDIILITDIHHDHLNIETLDGLKLDNAIFIVPKAVEEKLSYKYKKKSVIINNNEKNKIAGISIKAIPMYNLPESSESRHIKGRGNGYVLKLGAKNIYISGDTEDITEMRNLKNIDIAFICMNLPYTMNIKQAVSAVLEFKPKVIYPFHYRGKGGFSDVEAFKQMIEDKNSNIQVKLKRWYPYKK